MTPTTDANQGPFAIRPRRAADLPALGDALWAQQPETRYPFRNPLPIPTEDFLHAHDAPRAWVAELDGRPVGHVCRLGPQEGHPHAEEMNDACAQAHGVPTSNLAWVTALFVAREARGHGIGRALLDTVVSDIEATDDAACLQVLPVYPAAASMYRAAGWRDVLQLRPQWLLEAVGNDGPDVHVMILTG